MVLQLRVGIAKGLEPSFGEVLIRLVEQDAFLQELEDVVQQLFVFVAEVVPLREILVCKCSTSEHLNVSFILANYPVGLFGFWHLEESQSWCYRYSSQPYLVLGVADAVELGVDGTALLDTVYPFLDPFPENQLKCL